ncbi:T-cell receptor beta chain V region 3H.25 [Heterocephalus glaber]|nr:T-cell receptor beta chain V region 3H.25 [Heterocephalus glaber]
MDTEITQTLRHLIKGKDQKTEIYSVPQKEHRFVYWCHKKLEEELKFFVYSQNELVIDTTEIFNQRFSAQCPQNSPCSLEIKSIELADSAPYFCASSQATVLTESSS